jgi:hypothetical protein
MEDSNLCTYCGKPHSTGEKQAFTADNQEKYCCEKCYQEHALQADKSAKKETVCEFC